MFEAIKTKAKYNEEGFNKNWKFFSKEERRCLMKFLEQAGPPFTREILLLSADEPIL